MNNCKEFRDHLVEVAFGDAERSPQFGQHIERCADCRKEFEAMQFAASGIEDSRVVPAPSLNNERLHQAILSRELKSRPSWLPRLSFAGAAAALALAAWMGFNQPTGNRPEDLATNVVNPPLREPSGPIEIPEQVPDVVAPPLAASEPAKSAQAVVSSPGSRSKRTSSRRSVQPSEEVVERYEPIPDDLLAVAVGGAEGALELDQMPEGFGGGGAALAPSMMRSDPGGSNSDSGEKAIVVIQPKGKAMEKSSDDVPIGG